MVLLALKGYVRVVLEPRGPAFTETSKSRGHTHTHTILSQIIAEISPPSVQLARPRKSSPHVTKQN